MRDVIEIGMFPRWKLHLVHILIWIAISFASTISFNCFSGDDIFQYFTLYLPPPLLFLSQTPLRFVVHTK